MSIPDMRELRRFLIVRTDRIGDVLLTTPVAAAIKSAVPDAQVVLLARRLTEVIGRRNRFIDDVLCIDGADGTKKTFGSIVGDIRRGRFDCVVLAHPTFEHALQCAAARIGTRVGTAYRLYSPLFTVRHREHRKESVRHEVEYNLSLLKPLGIEPGAPEFSFELTDGDRESAKQAVRDTGIVGDGRFFIVHPGSGGSAMDWHAERYGELISLIGDEYGFDGIVTWGRGEERLAEEVVALSRGAGKKLARVLPLETLAALMKKAAFVIAPSTGVLHLANTVGTPVIGLYPAVSHMSPRRWGPYGDHAVSIIPDVEGTGIPPDDLRSMELITPAIVLDRTKDFLKNAL